MLQQVVDKTHWEAWNKYRPDNMQTWDDILFIIFWLDGASTDTFII
jgi:hypothetical protein